MIVECYFEENMQYVDIDEVIEEQEIIEYCKVSKFFFFNNKTLDRRVERETSDIYSH